MLREDEKFYLPNLYQFRNDNVFYGSYRGLRFRVKSQKTQEEGQETQWGMETLCWYGEYCLEESEVAERGWFPMSEEGYEQVLDWLESQYARLQARQAAAPAE